MQVDVQHFGPWDELVAAFADLNLKLHTVQVQEVRKFAMLLVREIKKGIVSGAPGGKKLADNAASTVARKGSSKPLIDQGLLINSVTELLMGDKAFVGLLYTARNANGDSLANIGAVMEFGATVTMPNGKTFVIPARPFLGPVMAQHMNTFLTNLRRAIADVFAAIGH